MARYIRVTATVAIAEPRLRAYLRSPLAPASAWPESDRTGLCTPWPDRALRGHYLAELTPDWTGSTVPMLLAPRRSAFLDPACDATALARARDTAFDVRCAAPGPGEDEPAAGLLERPWPDRVQRAGTGFFQAGAGSHPGGRRSVRETVGARWRSGSVGSGGTAGNGTGVNGGVSFWWGRLGIPDARPALPGNREVDVCVVGGGYTGLWTAYYLKKADPGLRIAVLEQRFCGYGASGRNGGWLYNGFAGRGAFARQYGQEQAAAMQRVMDRAVGEVADTLAAENIDADLVRGGVLEVARTPAQLARLRAFTAAERAYGTDRVQDLDATEAAHRLNVAGALGAVWSPHGARLQPAKLAAGLAEAVERLGVELYEGTPVTAIRGGRKARAVTPHGTVTARYVLRATEGFTSGLAGERRTWLPMNSAMIATEPLPASFWEETGWERREVLGDFAHAYMYAQRTADDRIALGGRGVPYRFGSRTDTDGATQPATVRQLREILHEFFPAARTARIEHAWAGVLGVPRDWCATVDLDRRTGLGWAGGYVGSGVTTTNLAGRTLRDLVLGHDTELTRLPWVGHTVRRWEPEPLRWLGVHALYAAYHTADRQEATRRRPTTSPLARLADTIAGR